MDKEFEKQEKEEFNKLQKQNEKIRGDIQKGFNSVLKNKRTKTEWERLFWSKINELIENEIEQEEMCHI